MFIAFIMSIEKLLTFQEFVAHVQDEVRKKIDKEIKDRDMRYALEGGKLLRPIMLMLSFRACNGGMTGMIKPWKAPLG